MANIKLKSLITEAEDFQARSKQTGKLVHFKSKDSYQAALKAGTHEDPKDKKGGEPKVGKPNDMFGGDYAKSRGGEAPKTKQITDDDVHALTSYKDFNKFFKANSDKLNKQDLPYIEDEIGALKYLESDYKRGDADWEEVLVAYEDLQDLIKKAMPKDKGGNDSNWIDNIDKIDTSDIKGKADPNADSFTSADLYAATFKDPETGKTITVGDAYDREDDSPAYKKAFAYVAKFDPDKEAVMGTQAYDDLQKKVAPKVNLPKKASQLTYKDTIAIGDALNKELGLDGVADSNMSSMDPDNNTIVYSASAGDEPTYSLYFGPNDDYGKPDEFRVSLESTYGNDPSNLSGKNDKSFKSAEDAMKYMIALGKKYKKELQMDDGKNESTKLTSMIKK